RLAYLTPNYENVPRTHACSILEMQQRRRDDARQRAQASQDGIGHRFVDVDQRDRHSADALATELQSGDVDLRFPEQHPHAADHAGHIAIVEHHDVPFRHRLEIEIVDLHQADHVAPKDRARHHALAAGGANADAEKIEVPFGLSRLRFDHFDTAFAGDLT